MKRDVLAACIRMFLFFIFPTAADLFWKNKPEKKRKKKGKYSQDPHTEFNKQTQHISTRNKDMAPQQIDTEFSLTFSQGRRANN